ncbi:hypothetical protein BO82DRAFT_304933 [Aspergillus uvarum CBS 121591]|uniref:Uncharacterized protein n=1 Tax=Aspergillus uvarum CBS 121591 TaxID=1448315 RepID=A0A319CK20_9EURO|nr:hypothetical protein BO82DRAFT_304933 [Aspergillus uvarum CBS 121591]PYH84181.1 hypothetical protein BO82DRAFT_304933 [Aspergillus uvarum CBS 121591]
MDEFPYQKPAVFSSPSSLLIVDEAQASYKDDLFWGVIIKEQLEGAKQTDMRICLVCAYGSPTTGVEPGTFTPATLNTTQRISLTADQAPYSPPIGIFFDRPEFDDAISRKIKYLYFDSFALDEEARDYIFSFTNGHPAAVDGIFTYIYHFYHSKIAHKELSVITKESVTSCLEEQEDVWRYLLHGCSIKRSFPDHRMEDGDADILTEILEHGSMKWNRENAAMGRCYLNGWIHKTLVCDTPNSVGKEYVVLPSRLHEKWVERHIGNEKALLGARFGTLQSLCIAALSRFSVMSLRHCSEGKKLSSGTGCRPVEAQYQDEFYKAFGSIAGRAVPIPSEWSRTKDGRVDFYIPEKKWAIEFLRDHRDIDKHVSRFHKGGAYYDWLQEGRIQEWIVINCATTLHTKVHPEPNLIHAIFLADYTMVRVFDHQGTKLDEARLRN